MLTNVKQQLYLGMNAKPWQTIYSASPTPKYPLGAFFDDEWGRRFRYALNSSAAALVAGNIVQCAPLGGATTTLQSAATINTAAPAGTTRFYVTAATTGQAANLFAEGWAAFWDSTRSAVYMRRIKANGPLSTTGPTDLNSWIEIFEDEPLPVALVPTSDRVALQVNPYRNIIVAPTTLTGMILGGVNGAVPASNYCWVQTRGWFGVRLKDVTTNIGVGPVTTAGTTAGSVINPAESGTGAYKQFFGQSTALWLDEYAGIVFLQCE